VSARIGPHWPVETIELEGPQRVSFEIEPQQRPLLRRLIGGPAAARTAAEAQLGVLAATRVGGNVQTVPLSEACGRFVDWYEPGGHPQGE
jgi:hypothetical protein